MGNRNTQGESGMTKRLKIQGYVDIPDNMSAEDFCGEINGAAMFINDHDLDTFTLYLGNYEEPAADVVEVRHDFNVGDFCLYGFADGNKSLAIVEIAKILSDERGIAEVKFHKVIKDNTGNGFFNYLLKKGGTMNASFEYLQNITPKVDGERREENV